VTLPSADCGDRLRQPRRDIWHSSRLENPSCEANERGAAVPNVVARRAHRRARAVNHDDLTRRGERIPAADGTFWHAQLTPRSEQDPHGPSYVGGGESALPSVSAHAMQHTFVADVRI